jgi:prepilin-type N-terminal cleavage/methylation domain-containing protein
MVIKPSLLLLLAVLKLINFWNIRHKITYMKIWKETNGFTLIEILIATIIITIASLGVATLTVGVMRENSFSKRLAAATALVQDQLEEVKRLGYSNAATAAGTQHYGAIANFTGYKRVVTVSSNTPAANMKTVDVTVFWDADKHSVKASTIISE